MEFKNKGRSTSQKLKVHGKNNSYFNLISVDFLKGRKYSKAQILKDSVSSKMKCIGALKSCEGSKDVIAKYSAKLKEMNELQANLELLLNFERT